MGETIRPLGEPEPSAAEVVERCGGPSAAVSDVAARRVVLSTGVCC